MADDRQLLRRYATDGSEAAFGELVGRHLNLVFSAALRRTGGDTQLAQDVAQLVFTDLARKARSLSEDAVLAGWLHRATHYAVAQLLRTERRRVAREQEAVAMNTPDSNPVWEQIRPLLDEALDWLDATDRDAVLLRYFEHKSAKEIGQTLGTSEEAAQKRVSRAVERLREFFAKRGITVGASGLVALISANAVQAAPVGLAVTVSTAAAMAGTTIAATIATQTTATTMNWLNIKTIAAIVVAAVTAGTGTHFVQQHEATRLRDENQNLIAEREKLTNERNTFLSAEKANRDELVRLRKNQSELLRLRGEVGVLRNELALQKRQVSQQTALPQPMNTINHPPGSYIAKDQMTFAGYATPEAATESFVWTALHGTYEQFLETMSPEHSAEESKDPSSREKFETFQSNDAPLFKGIQILAKKVVAEDRVELKIMYFEGKSEKSEHCSIQPMGKIGSEWKRVGSTQGCEETWDKAGQVQKFVP